MERKIPKKEKKMKIEEDPEAKCTCGHWQEDHIEWHEECCMCDCPKFELREEDDEA
jgi:hypothetical protein